MLQNPILLSALFGVITYIYMYWQQTTKQSKKKNKKIKINYIPIAVVCVMVWFISSQYFDESGLHDCLNTTSPNAEFTNNTQIYPIIPNTKFINNKQIYPVLSNIESNNDLFLTNKLQDIFFEL